MTSTTPTRAAGETDADDVARLHEAIDTCDPAPLLMSLVHVTGDSGILDRFESRLDFPEPGNHYKSGIAPVSPPGEYPEDMVAEIRALAREVQIGRAHV